MTPTDKIRIGRLDSLGGVLAEMARLYREARRGMIEEASAVRLVRVLAEMRATLEVSDVERRLDALESGGADDDWTPPLPGETPLVGDKPLM